MQIKIYNTKDDFTFYLCYQAVYENVNIVNHSSVERSVKCDKLFQFIRQEVFNE